MPNVQQSIGSGTELLNMQRTQWENACLGHAKLQRWTNFCEKTVRQLGCPKLKPARISSAPMCSSAKWYTAKRFCIKHGIPSHFAITMLKLQDLGVWPVCWLVKDRQRRRLEDSYAKLLKQKRIKVTLRWNHWEDLGSVAKRCMGYDLVTVLFSCSNWD